MREPRETKDLRENKDLLDLKAKSVRRVKLESPVTLVPRVLRDQLGTTEKRVCSCSLLSLNS